MKLFENKKSNLSTEQKVMKGYKAYCGAVMAGALIMCTAMPAFATTITDPLTVVNNLSEFIFGLIRAIGMILLGFGIVQVGLSPRMNRSAYWLSSIRTSSGVISSLPPI